jgi:uncharacterized membrane protein
MARTGLPALLFLVSGTLHEVRPALFLAIVPPQFGPAHALVAISGAAELAGGLGLLLPATRRAAALGLIALLVAVWPANWYMAFAASHFAAVATAWVIWLRVPLQLPLIWWVALALRRSAPHARSVP